MDGEMNKKVVDLSPFFLFEAVGDSEGDFDHQSMMMKMMMVGRLGDVHNHDDVDEDEDEDDDEDAESCSNDVWDRDTSHANGIGARRGTNHDNQHHYDDDDDDDDIDGHKVMKGKSSKGYHDGDDGNAWNESSRYDHDHDHNNNNINNNNKSTSEVMSTANSHASRNSSCEGKQMSEKERSRLFWEACLAS